MAHLNVTLKSRLGTSKASTSRKGFSTPRHRW